MNRLFTILSFLLILLAPTTSLGNSASETLLQATPHIEMGCGGETSYATNLQKCCSAVSVTPFHNESLTELSAFVALQKVVYFQYNQTPLFAVNSPLYRPPIV